METINRVEIIYSNLHYFRMEKMAICGHFEPFSSLFQHFSPNCPKIAPYLLLFYIFTALHKTYLPLKRPLSVETVEDAVLFLDNLVKNAEKAMKIS